MNENLKQKRKHNIKSLKRCSTSLVKITMSYHYIPIRTTTIKNSDYDKCWQGCGETWSLIHCQCECKTASPLWKMFFAVFMIGFNNHKLGHLSQRNKNSLHTKTCVQIFIETLFIGKYWKQLKCQSMGEWLNKL